MEIENNNVIHKDMLPENIDEDFETNCTKLDVDYLFGKEFNRDNNKKMIDKGGGIEIDIDRADVVLNEEDFKKPEISVLLRHFLGIP